MAKQSDTPLAARKSFYTKVDRDTLPMSEEFEITYTCNPTKTRMMSLLAILVLLISIIILYTKTESFLKKFNIPHTSIEDKATHDILNSRINSLSHHIDKIADKIISLDKELKSTQKEVISTTTKEEILSKENLARSQELTDNYVFIITTTLLLLIMCISVTFIGDEALNNKEYKIMSKGFLIVHIQFFIRTINNLDKSILRYTMVGISSTILSTGTIVILIISVFSLFSDTSRYAEIIKDDKIGVLILLIIRSSMVGGLILAVILKLISFSTKSFDQAARFTKRKHSTLFLMQILTKDGFELTQLNEAMHAFTIWNSSIDSAFTDHNNKTKEDTKISMDMYSDMIRKAKEFLGNKETPKT